LEEILRGFFMKKMDKREYNRLYKRKQRGSVLERKVTGVTKGKAKIVIPVFLELKEKVQIKALLEKKSIASYVRDILEREVSE
jgi:hypothetical protein